jgi:cyclohexanone monooxygenase
VTLVDTQGRGVERISDHALVVNGREYEVDCLIHATGFEVGVTQAFRSDYELYGVGGVSLTDKWSEGVTTLHGVLTRGFPNCFIMSGAQATVTVNYLHTVNEQAKHMAYIIATCKNRGAQAVQPTQAAEDEWVDTIVAKADVSTAFFEECTPGYRNNEGKVEAVRSLKSLRSSLYGPGSLPFYKVLRDWRAEGGQKGLEFSQAERQTTTAAPGNVGKKLLCR